MFRGWGSANRGSGVRAALCGALLVLAFSGCGALSGATLVAPQAPHELEALSYFPADAPLVATVDTGRIADLRVPLEAGDLLGHFKAFTNVGVLHLAQLEPILGNDAVVGVPRLGASPLIALAARDADTLESIAKARVAAGQAAAAGRYRDAELFYSPTYAFAVRDGMLLVSRTTADLRDALDLRAGDESTLTLEDFENALPRVGKVDPLIRAVGDAGALTARLSPKLRAIPWLAAVDRVGLVARRRGTALVVDVKAATTAGDLVELDVPVSPGRVAPRAAVGEGVRVSVRDIAHLLGYADRVAANAVPLAHLRYQRARGTLRRRGRAKVDLAADVIRKLHGPGTLVFDGGRLLLRADPSRPQPLRAALDRLAARLSKATARAGLGQAVVGREGGLYVVDVPGRTIRFGMVGDVLVAGDATAERLKELAKEELARPAGAAGPLTFRIPPRAIPGSDWQIDGWVRGTPRELRARLELS